ncbi:MAG: 4a-hydroxytetrahydrobiopterin dehydratase [candidate division WOR-3 bacterium]
MNNWKLEPPKLKKEYKFKNFLSAINFVNEVAKISEQLNHHPNIYIYYNVVVIETWTHSENNITQKDYELAKKIDEVLEQLNQK